MTRVLVVDDNPVDQQRAGGFVSREGYSPLFANDGREALDLMEQELPEIVLTDMQMPEMDGLTLVKEIKTRYPRVLVVLMTSQGSEEVAIEALNNGATSYVPKDTFKESLTEAFKVVEHVLQTQQEREQVYQFLTESQATYELGLEKTAPRILIGHFQEGLRNIVLVPEAEINQLSTALTEALVNAIDHGNLELDSALREKGDGTYYRLAEERSKIEPYCNRKVSVRAEMKPYEARFIIRDEGPGFDPNSLPDPRDPANIIKASGRGLLLIQAFMTSVEFNAQGNEITLVKIVEPPV